MANKFAPRKVVTPVARTKHDSVQIKINDLTKKLKAYEELKWGFLRLSRKYRRDYRARGDRNGPDPFEYNLVDWIDPKLMVLPRSGETFFHFSLPTLKRKPGAFPPALKSERFACINLAISIPAQIAYIEVLVDREVEEWRDKKRERERIRGFSLDEDSGALTKAQQQVVRNYLKLLEWDLNAAAPTDDEQMEQLFGSDGDSDKLLSQRAAAIRLRDGGYKYLGFSAYVERETLIHDVAMGAKKAEAEERTKKKREKVAQNKGHSTNPNARLVRGKSARKT